jgi:hypothetical protein
MPAPRDPLRIWLHEGHDGDPGVVAFAPDQLGFSTWSATAPELLASLPAKFHDYAAWRARHGVPIAGPTAEVEVPAPSPATRSSFRATASPRRRARSISRSTSCALRAPISRPISRPRPKPPWIGIRPTRASPPGPTGAPSARSSPTSRTARPTTTRGASATSRRGRPRMRRATGACSCREAASRPRDSSSGFARPPTWPAFARSITASARSGGRCERHCGGWWRTSAPTGRAFGGSCASTGSGRSEGSRGPCGAGPIPMSNFGALVRLRCRRR